jgi:ribose-phosphate pyrophosphokinase
METVYVCTESPIKVSATKKFIDILQKVNAQNGKSINYNVNFLNDSWGTTVQPFNNDTIDCCLTRMAKAKEQYVKSDAFTILSIESGIFELDKPYDICVLVVNRNGNISRWFSFGIEIDEQLYSIYKKYILDTTKLITYGEFLHIHFGVHYNNFMKDVKFGNIDREEQIFDCFKKYILSYFTDIIPNYPKPNILFKHITSIIVNPILCNILYGLYERYIRDNYDIDSIDYFAGLDARGFYFAPVLANMFKKSFLPIHKANKTPHTEEYHIIRESYTTEYSKDEFGIEQRKIFEGKTILILDDLLATGGTIIDATEVAQKAGFKVYGAVTFYDVASLRNVAKEKFKANNINCNVILNEYDVPNDFKKISYKLPDITLKRLEHELQTKDTNMLRKYTLHTSDYLKGENTLDLTNVKIMCAGRDLNFVDQIEKILISYTDKTSTKFNNTLVKVIAEKFNNGETRVEFENSVRNSHVIIISRTRTGHINDDLIELSLMIDACNRSHADKITVVLPYYPYARSDKKDSPHCPIGASMVANILKSLGVYNVVSIDLHAGQIQGYIDRGFHNLYLKKYICDTIYNFYLKMYPDSEWNDHFVLVAPDGGSAKMIQGYSKVLGINNVIMHKERNYAIPGTIAKSIIIGEKESYQGKTAIIIDDIADTMGTLCSASKVLYDNGVVDVIVIATHGVLSDKAIENINKTEYIKEIVVSDSLPQDDNLNKIPKLRVLHSSELIARTIDGIISGKSISRLF